MSAFGGKAPIPLQCPQMTQSGHPGASTLAQRPARMISRMFAIGDDVFRSSLSLQADDVVDDVICIRFRDYKVRHLLVA